MENNILEQLGLESEGKSIPLFWNCIAIVSEITQKPA